MINVAIVEDEKSASDKLVSCLYRFSKQYNEHFNITEFRNGVDFLTNYQAVYDIIFMDIEMPHLNGMEVAHKFRTMDETAILIFITNLSQYAIKGYEVDAMDYILKPLNYSAFSLKIKKAITYCNKRKSDKISISTRNGDICFAISSIIYIESNAHQIIYHTEQGDYIGYGTLKNVEPLLPKHNFFRCNSCYIINFSFVKGYHNFNVDVGSYTLIISRARKKQFKEELRRYHADMGRGQ